LSVYNYMLCAHGSKALWLGKRIEGGFRRGDVTRERLSQLAVTFLLSCEGNALAVIDEQDLPDEVALDEDSDNDGDSGDSLRLECSCGVATEHPCADLLAWLDEHRGHHFQARRPTADPSGMTA
jgi:hypothetical protein